MISTGKYFEEIVAMLNIFRSDVQTFSALSLTNINKHSENFIKRLLNLTYNYELDNLNKGKSNFPGIDLGDSDEGIAYQISATKKSEKIDETLVKCLKFHHYNSFKNINVFVLTKKQGSYTIKTSTEPHFTFTPEQNIIDFDDLFKDIEHLDLSRIKAMNEYIKAELQNVISSIRDNKTDEKKQILDVQSALEKSKMTTFSLWQSKVVLNNEKLSVPEIHNKLNLFLFTPALKNSYLPLFNTALRKIPSNKEILYIHELQETHAKNHFYGNAMLIESSSITIEKANYADNEIMFNLLQEMMMLLTSILFFSKEAKGNFEISVSISLEANTKVFFLPRHSLVVENLLNTFILDSPFEFTETITDVHTSTLADLLQKVMHGFAIQELSILSTDPFINIKRDLTEFVINNIKGQLGINDYSIL